MLQRKKVSLFEYKEVVQDIQTVTGWPRMQIQTVAPRKFMSMTLQSNLYTLGTITIFSGILTEEAELRYPCFRNVREQLTWVAGERAGVGCISLSLFRLLFKLGMCV